MKKTVKFSIIISILTILLISAFACSTPDGGGDIKTDDSVNPQQSDELTEATPERYTPNLPDDIDFKGYEFRAVVPMQNAYGSYTFCVDEENGEIINDAIYTRNRYIEGKYNVVFKQTEINDFWQLRELFRKSVLAGSDDFDVCVQIDRDAYNLAVEGFALSAEDLPHLDMTQPWYAKDINDALSVRDKYFIAYSDECMSLYEGYMIIAFNKKLVADLGLENPYNLVKDGKWTYDKLFEFSKMASVDIDGDGVMTESDRYGIVSQDDIFLSNFWVCAGLQTVAKNSADILVLNIEGNEKFYSVLEKARANLFGGDKIYFAAGTDKTNIFKPSSEQDGFRDISRQQFENNLALFYSATMAKVPAMRAMDADFGIIPFPKADEAQSRYCVRSCDGWPKIVPNHATNPERTSIILEALGAESRNTTLPAFKEVSLRTKFARDDESAEMIDIIFNSLAVDLGDLFFLEIRDAYMNEIRGNGNFASVTEKRSAAFQKILDKVNDAAGNLE